VLNLRAADADAAREGVAVRQAGMNYFNIASDALRPRDANVQRCLEVISNPDNQPVFVHCHHGADRTGYVVGAYRMRQQQWGWRDAVAEFERFNSHWWLNRPAYVYLKSIHRSPRAAQPATRGS
jgi:protein-tyrosine phosphatase